MNISDEGLKLTEDSEGLRLRAYRDTGGVLTIGYGHTGGVVENQVISRETAEALLKHDMDYAAGIVNSYALPCTQGQFDALVDFVFNIGPTQFLHSSLLRYHKAREYEKAAAEFPKWKYDNGKIVPGLVTRRAKERDLYSRQGLEEDHPHTDEQGRSEPSAPYSASSDQDQGAVQSSPALPAPASGTAPASGNAPAGFLSRLSASFRKLLKPAG